ncbi:hypothetical protein CSKR_203334 [Clonorchis sinensis]|uniref:Uncharacterized protein n=1 Tax=Clonorchis sinensis TaxID=79923 RepID=A0A8T1MAB6_CLOSI|nr:hypothetical protein CSKR_203334 [Clonorchis sinensis]
MGFWWLKNLIGVHLPDSQLQDIKHTRAELLFHVVYRSIQASSLIGSLVVAPLVTVVKQPRSLRVLHDRCLRYAVYGIAPGAAAGVVLYGLRMRNQPEEGYFDRCYRLRCNQSQVRIDRSSIFGALVGVGWSVLTPYRPIEAAIIGMYVGLVGGAVCNHFDR